MVAAQNINPVAPKEHFAPSLNESLGNFAAIFSPFIVILNLNVTYYACRHIITSSLK